VTDIAADTFDRAIAKTVLTLANELGLDCVVEGVENIEQHDILCAIGCTSMQGYYFGRPVPPAQLTALLRGAAPSGAPSAAAG
jgi:EAL domain-containing protein (putative c-di-GMP-specific phosphodiesterase class I)